MGKLIKRPAEAYALGYKLGLVRGQLIAATATPAEARAYERATLAIINAAHGAIIGGNSADYELHDEWARGVNDGQRVQLAHEADEGYVY